MYMKRFISIVKWVVFFIWKFPSLFLTEQKLNKTFFLFGGKNIDFPRKKKNVHTHMNNEFQHSIQKCKLELKQILHELSVSFVKKKKIIAQIFILKTKTKS